MMKKFCLIGFVLSVTLVACQSPVTLPGATNTPEQIPTTTGIAQPTMKSVTPTPEPTDTPTVQPTVKGVTLIPEPAKTPTASPAPIIPPTSTPTPTPSVDPQRVQVCGIGRVPPPQVNQQVLYFSPLWGDWYRTADKFTTVEWVAPGGVLSPDLQTLIVFDCDDPGSICVATPPQATPVPLPLHYAPHETAGGSVHWLPGNQRLIFLAAYVPLPSERKEGDEIDIRLYLLDLQAPELYQISDKVWPDWAASPLGTCVAYTVHDESCQSGRFHLTNVEETGEFRDWLSPLPNQGDKWPGWWDAIAWSPDGSRLAFARTHKSIVVWSPVPDERQEYEIKKSSLEPLKWSPNGDRIYFIATGSGGGLSHWILDLATGELQELAEASGYMGPGAYQWLPDGREIVVSGLFGSLLLDTSDGSTRKLTYPGSEDDWEIVDMFLGPASP